MRESPDPSRIRLSDGPAELEVAPAQGGCITAFRWHTAGGGVDWLRPAPPGADLTPNDSACFPLVPYSNRIRQGRFRFAGRDHQLKANFAPAPHTIHGHGWKLPWRVMAQDSASLALFYEHDGSDWPAPYRAEQRLSLHHGALTVELAVTNTGDTAMPAGLGLHPYFPRTPACRLTASVEGMWATDAEVMPTELLDANLSGGVSPDATPLDNGFTGFAGRAVIDWPERRASLTLEADAALSFLVVYTPAGKNFFCAEPVSHCTDAVNLAAERGDTGLQVLQPGERFAAAVRFVPRRDAAS
ncbi:aldose 1-epimerase [Pelagibius sp. 7325]|uniref:aldose 1-epimerase n=1 Tax=Pelagibius sp. 7325 TaxID=3131994 RepID=UPI0030EBA84B